MTLEEIVTQMMLDGGWKSSEPPAGWVAVASTDRVAAGDVFIADEIDSEEDRQWAWPETEAIGYMTHQLAWGEGAGGNYAGWIRPIVMIAEEGPR